MKKLTVALTLALATLMSFTATSSFAASATTQAELCATAPAKAADANIDCAATSRTTRDEDASANQYPAGPVHFSSGIVF